MFKIVTNHWLFTCAWLGECDSSSLQGGHEQLLQLAYSPSSQVSSTQPRFKVKSSWPLKWGPWLFLGWSWMGWMGPMGARWVRLQAAGSLGLLGSASLLLSRNGADSKQPCTQPPILFKCQITPPQLFPLLLFCNNLLPTVFWCSSIILNFLSLFLADWENRECSFNFNESWILKNHIQ